MGFLPCDDGDLNDMEHHASGKVSGSAIAQLWWAEPMQDDLLID